ncbi:MAG: type III pantothenate kinase [Bacteroidales bacterium]|jgi:type III pantothenate kinase|nr:type III pantothenate kinase [Bacteroidales bacterium]
MITGVIDIGNTALKAGVFENNRMMRFLYAPNVEDFNDFFCGPNGASVVEKMLVASVAGISDEVRNAVLQILPDSKIIFWDKPVPALRLPFSICNEYWSATGIDRFALAAGAVAQYPKSNVLCISLGTCVTYNFVSKDGVFEPGAISAGLSARLRAMHNEAPALPLVRADDYINILPLNDESIVDTSTSILHGCVNGLWYEIRGYIDGYNARYGGLTVLITGGDLIYYEKYVSGIYRIFATPNLVLQGLNEILQYNNF